MNLPQNYLERMKKLLKEDFDLYRESLEEKPYAGLRVNTLKITPEEFEKISPYPLKRVPWAENGYYYDTLNQPARHPFYHAGLYYIQEPSAMLPAALLPVEPGDRILDICAAPGGKSTELAAKLKGTGLLVSNDISYSRAKALVKNLELAGVSNGIVLSENPDKLKERFRGFFDKILIDAPCSGEGMFRRDSSMVKSYEEKGNSYYGRLQREIIDAAVLMVKPGGFLLYSTCTFSPLENEESIAYLLSRYPEFSVVNVEGREGFDHGRPEWADGSKELLGCVRLWPFRIRGEGHFAALLKKSGGEPKGKERPKPSAEKPVEEVAAFFKENGLCGQSSLYEGKEMEIRDGKVYALPLSCPDLKGLRVLRSGLYLGELKKSRFEPSQALAMCLNSRSLSGIRLEPSDGRTIKYLKGETIELDETEMKGWQPVSVLNYPLGWGKADRGSLKNKYYPGWRWM